MIDYELSLWNHQDQYLGLLRGLVEFEGQAYSPVFKTNVNGDMSLTFSIPAVIFNKETGEFEENRLWNFILNEQKVRLVRFKNTEQEEIFEFVIKNFIEKRDGIAKIIDVECKSYAIYELARIGYEAQFSEKTMEDLGPSSKANLNYWMEKALAFTKNKYDAINNTAGWRYEIQPEILYENNKVIGYTDNGDGTFTAIEGSPLEKERIIKIERSNVFNIIQELAEKFSVWAHFEYEYGVFGNIISRKIIFKEEIEKDAIYSITYAVNSTELSKNSDSNELATKVWIESIDSDLENSGVMSFSEAPQNLMMENFIYNFDYFKNSGFISQSDYDYINTDLSYSIRNKNIQIKQKQSDLTNAEIELNKLIADSSFIGYEIAAAQEMQQDALSRASSFTTQNTTIPATTYFVINRGSYKYVDLSSRKGIISISSVKTFSGTGVSYTIDLDKNNPKYIVAIRPTTTEDKLKIIYTYNTYEYYMDLNQNELYKEETLRDRLNQISIQTNAKQVEVNSLNQDIATLLNEKQTIIDEFEHDFYFAIKEANWKDSEYKLRKEYFYVNNPEIAETAISTNSYVISSNLNDIDFTTIKVYNSDYSYPYFEKADFTLEYGKIGTTKVLLLIPTATGAFSINKLTGGGSTLFNDNASLKVSYSLISTGVRIATDLTINRSTTATISNRSYTIQLPNILTSTIVVTTENGNAALNENIDYSLDVKYDSIVIKFKTTVDAKYLTNYYKIEAYKNITSQFYYNDAVEVAERVSVPNVSYSIGAVDLSSLDGFENFIPKVGQKILITDRELHFVNQYGFLSEISFDLDSPSNTQLTISNYKTRFEDLFQRIAATTQALNLRGDAIDRVLDTLPPSRIINPEILQRTVEENSIILSNSVNNEVKWSSDGITLTDKGTSSSAPGQVKLVGNGIFLSNQILNGERVWRTGITPSGINASEITTGTLNTGKIIIWDETNARFLWNSDGLFAYDENLDGTSNFNRFIRFNSDGLVAYSDYSLGQKTFEIKADGSATFTGSINILAGSTGIENLGGGALALLDSIDFTSQYLTGVPASLGTPTGTGLFLDSTHMGYYTGGQWVTYMDNNGNFYLGGTSGPLTWSGGVLTIGGSGNIRSYGFVGVVDGSAFSTTGTNINLATGAITAKNFRIDSTGNAYFKGNISGSTITGSSFESASQTDDGYFKVLGGKLEARYVTISGRVNGESATTLYVEGAAEFNDAIFSAYCIPNGDDSPSLGRSGTGNSNRWNKLYCTNYVTSGGTVVNFDNVYYSGKANMSVNYASSAGSADSVDWSNINSKPSTYPPSSHTHGTLTLTGSDGNNTIGTYNGTAKTININADEVGAAWAGHTHTSFSSNVTINAQTRLYGNSYTYSVYPNANNSYYLGNSMWRWIDIWCMDSTLNGSDLRLKKDILPIEKGIEFILSLNPIQYKWNWKENGRNHYGFLAQEIKQLFDTLNIDSGLYSDPTVNPDWDVNNPEENDSPHYLALRYTEFIAPMVQTIQYLNNKINNLEEIINNFEQRITLLENK